MYISHITKHPLMILKKKSPFTGKVNEMEIPITEAQLEAYYQSGASIQRFFPKLTPDQREFIMTGIPPEEFPSEIDD